MTIVGGERTFFHCRGANANFSPADIEREKVAAEIFHLGYLLLLDQFDAPGAAPEFLRQLQQRGVRTSIDVVSENSDRFARVVKPALAYCDYAIMNEIEAGNIAGLEPTRENLPRIAAALLACGVKRQVVIHCPEVGCCLEASGKFTVVPSLDLPPDYVKTNVGAGDAFCAGMLWAFYHDWDATAALRLAACAAATNLAAASSTAGALPLAETLALGEKYAWRK
jgi:sugar/nucleoside kinase (ribokinase family)